MILKSHTELAAGFPTVCVELVRCPADTIVEVAADVQRRGREILFEVGLGALADAIAMRPRITVGVHRSTHRTASLPFRLWAEDGGRTCWTLDSSLDAAWLGPGRTYLALSCQYDVSFATAAATFDRALVHRVAEVGAQHFVEIAGRRLTGCLLA
jgi:hypothetical protein